jgi:hypothetical protein
MRQTYLILAIGSGLCRVAEIPHGIAAPAPMIGAGMLSLMLAL